MNYITRIEKETENGAKWTCVSNNIIDDLKLTDMSVMAVLLRNKSSFNQSISDLQNKTGLARTKLNTSTNRLTELGYIKQVQSKMKRWELYVDETGTTTFKKYINRDSCSGFTQVSNCLIERLGNKDLCVEELGILLLLLGNKDTYEETKESLQKKISIGGVTFSKYFDRLIDKGFIRVLDEVIYTDESGMGNFQSMTRIYKKKVLIRQISQPINFANVQQEQLVKSIAMLPKEQWVSLSQELRHKVKIQHLKNVCKMLAA